MSSKSSAPASVTRRASGARRSSAARAPTSSPSTATSAARRSTSQPGTASARCGRCSPPRGDAGGEPMRWPVAIADMTTGVHSAIAILAALLSRERTGRGQFIDSALLDSQLSWAPIMASEYFAPGQRPPRLGNVHATIVPYQVFKARDKYMIVAVGPRPLWTSFCEVIGLAPEVRDDPRFASNPDRLVHRGDLIPVLETIFVQHDAAHWLERLGGGGVTRGPINALDETL